MVTGVPRSASSSASDRRSRTCETVYLLLIRTLYIVRIEDVILDGVWPANQTGYAVLFTPRNQDGRCPWCVVEDVTMERFVIRNAAAGFVLLGTDDNNPSQPMQRVTIRDGLMVLDPLTTGGDSRCWMILSAPAYVTIDKVTCLNHGNIMNVEGGREFIKAKGFVYTSNIQRNGPYGIIGTETGSGTDTLARFFDGPVFANNVIAGGDAGYLPPGTQTPTEAEFRVLFANFEGGNYCLKTYAGIGADCAKLPGVPGAMPLPAPVPAPSPSVPAPDPCVVRPLVVTVSRWPAGRKARLRRWCH